MLYFAPLVQDPVFVAATGEGAALVAAHMSETPAYPPRVDYNKSKALCLFPLNSTAIFDTSTITLGGDTIIDNRVNRTRTIVQQKLPQDYQQLNKDAFFETGDEELFGFNCWETYLDETVNPNEMKYKDIKDFTTTYAANQTAPGLYKTDATAAAKAILVFYKTFTVPFMLLHSVFELGNGQFPMLVSGNSEINLQLKFLNYDFRKIFMTTNLLHADTGITEIELQLYNKTTKSLQSNDPVLYGDVLRRIVSDSQSLDAIDGYQNL